MEGETWLVARLVPGSVRRLLVTLIIAAVGCGGPGAPSPSPGPSTSAAPLDPLCPVGPDPASTSGDDSGPPFAPPGTSGEPPVPPPYVPPEGLEDLNDLARLSGQFPAATPAAPEAEGVIYLGTKGVQTIDDFMDQVVDNAEFFWRRLLEGGGIGCEVERVARIWSAADSLAAGPCSLSISANRPAYYCGTSGANRTDGTIVVGQRWMYDVIYQRFGDRADFAVASVLAHEMGHHVQDALGLLRDQRPFLCCGLLSLNIELHADCLGGVWASSLYGRGEIDLETMADAVRLAGDAGDLQPTDRTSARAHGTSEERRHWYSTGFESGSVDACHGALEVAP